MMKRLCLFFFLLSLKGFCGDLDDSPNPAHLVANKQVDVSSLSTEDLENIFLGKQRMWKDGSRIRLAVFKGEGDGVKEVTGRSASQYRAHWRNLVFSGYGIMPKFFSSEAKLLEYVAKTKGAIGGVFEVMETDGSAVTLFVIKEGGVCESE